MYLYFFSFLLGSLVVFCVHSLLTTSLVAATPIFNFQSRYGMDKVMKSCVLYFESEPEQVTSSMPPIIFLLIPDKSKQLARGGQARILCSPLIAQWSDTVWEQFVNPSATCNPINAYYLYQAYVTNQITAVKVLSEQIYLESGSTGGGKAADNSNVVAWVQCKISACCVITNQLQCNISVSLGKKNSIKMTTVTSK